MAASPGSRKDSVNTGWMWVRGYSETVGNNSEQGGKSRETVFRTVWNGLENMGYMTSAK